MGRISVSADGKLGVPADEWQVGWWETGGVPGEPGYPLVLVGHSDARNGPAVFSRLGHLKPEDEALVEDVSGSRTSCV